MKELINKKHKQAFSLIEMIVSLALFSVILVVALGALLSVIDANRKAKSIKLVVNNLNLALEGMSRELRVGSNICRYANGTNAPTVSCNGSNLNQIFFTTDRGQTNSSFRLHNGGVERRMGPDAADNQFLRLTGSDVIVDDLQFFIRNTGFEASGLKQPSVVIILSGHIGVAGQRSDFNIQTTVSQRKLEL